MSQVLSAARTLVRLVSSTVAALLIALVRAYQIVLSPMHGPSCRFQPTCSAYAIKALQRHGPIWGVLLTTWRLARCHPLGGFGYAPVPVERSSLKLLLSRFSYGPHHAS